MLNNVCHSITQCNQKGPSKSDNSLAEIDESGPKSGPENGPKKPKTLGFLYFSSSYWGFDGAQERQSINLEIHLIIDTYVMPSYQEWS